MKTCVCAFLKNENIYLNEWLTHYIKLGFSNIYLFDNNDCDGEDPKDILTSDISNFVTIDYTFRNKYDKLYQRDAYLKFYIDNYSNYDWILYCDIDEFLILNNYEDIVSFLSNENFNNFDAIALYWKIFDDNDLIYYDNRPVLERFTRLSNSLNPQIKSIINCKKNIDFEIFKQNICAHGLRNANYCNDQGIKLNKFELPYSENEYISYKYAWINHYRFKTLEEFMKIKYKNWHSEFINKNKYINLDGFFKYNKKTPEKLAYLKSIGINYENNNEDILKQ